MLRPWLPRAGTVAVYAGRSPKSVRNVRVIAEASVGRMVVEAIGRQGGRRTLHGKAGKSQAFATWVVRLAEFPRLLWDANPARLRNCYECHDTCCSILTKLKSRP
jgi:hypothetical protein